MITILDGGMGRELKRIGAPFRQPEWSALALTDAPEMVVQAHRSFADAGAEVITTNNYAVVPFHIGTERFANEAETLTALAGKLAREAATPGVKVGGCLPPLSGSYRPEWYDADLAASAYPRIVAALDPYVDIWQAETMSSIVEARSVANAIKDSDKPFWLAYSLKDDLDMEVPCLRSEESLEEALELAIECKADAMLFNCSMPEVIGRGLAYIAPLCNKKAPSLLTGGYANAFAPRDANIKANSGLSTLRDDISTEQYLQIAQEWKQSGASIIGGCCGIGPEHIAALGGLK